MGKPDKKPEAWWGINIYYADKKGPVTVVPVDRVIITPKKIIIHYHQHIHGKPVFPEKHELSTDEVLSVTVGRII